MDYNSVYKNAKLFWKEQPSDICLEILDKFPPDKFPKIIDIGAGEGRNAIFFAKQGYKVTAVDISKNGINKIKKIAKIQGVEIKTIVEDITNLKIEDTYDIVFSMGTLHYVESQKRKELFERLKESTRFEGINVISVFVYKPFIKELRTDSEIRNLFCSGELMSYYGEWKILNTMEKIKECKSGGIPHQHAKNVVIAQKMGRIEK